SSRLPAISVALRVPRVARLGRARREPISRPRNLLPGPQAMLSILADLLRDSGLLAPDAIPDFNIRLITGEQLNVQVFSSDGSFFHTRVKRPDVVPEEYDRCLHAWRSFPKYAPQPLRRHVTDAWEV